MPPLNRLRLTVALVELDVHRGGDQAVTAGDGIAAGSKLEDVAADLLPVRVVVVVLDPVRSGG